MPKLDDEFRFINSHFEVEEDRFALDPLWLGLLRLGALLVLAVLFVGLVALVVIGLILLILG